MRIGALVAAVALAGCATESEVDWHGDETFTTSERAEIEHANVWLADRLHVAPFSIAWDAPHRSYPEPGEIGRIDTATEDEGGYYYQSRIVIAADRVGLYRVAGVAAHEMAHARGLHHHDGVGLMASTDASLVSPLAWTSDDEDLVGGPE